MAGPHICSNSSLPEEVKQPSSLNAFKNYRKSGCGGCGQCYLCQTSHA